MSWARARWARSRRYPLGRWATAAVNEVRWRDSAATDRVSRTVRSGNSRDSWNARPRPSAARRSGVNLSTGRSSRSTRPVEGTKPPMAFISVDFPAPLVPISPTTSPAWTLIEALLTATRPPNTTVISWAISTGPAGGGDSGRVTTLATSRLGGGSGSGRRAAYQDRKRSRPVSNTWAKPPGKYISSASSPIEEVRSGTIVLAGQTAGRPTIHRAPRIGPATVPAPPITATAMMLMESSSWNRSVRPMETYSPAISAPASPATTPDTANAWIPAREGEIVYADAAVLLSRTASHRRPTPVARILVSRMITATSTINTR